ncbi:MAG: fatty-acid--CoA ligase [Alphaproteobacteria bacterium]|nr:MAG: fatty-acid--CoA ligase [Alphaproteobacteria bacterium]
MSDFFNLSYIPERLALVQGDNIATIFEGRQQTWRDFQDRITRLAGGLLTCGVARRDFVAVLAENSDRFFELYFTPAWIGAVLTPLNTRWSYGENLYALQDSGAKTLFFDDSFRDIARNLKDNPDHAIETFIYMGEEDCPDWALSYEQLILDHDPAVQVRTKGHDMAALMYTGGTTGTPKGVMLSHMGIWSSIISASHGMGCRDDDIYLHAAPMFHVGDYGVSMAAALAGATQVMIRRFSVGGVLDAISDQQVTMTLLVPTMVKMLLADEKTERADISNLRQLIYGASPMPEGLLVTCMERLTAVDLVQVYGQTELSPLATVLPASDHTFGNKRLRSAGKAGLCVSLRIEDEGGNILPTGEVGQVVIHGPNVMLGYWNKPEVTAAALKDGWVHTGDAGYLDRDGYLYLVDRLKDMIITGAENVYSAEVESVISLCPGVLDVAVIGIPDAEWGEAVHALVILKAGAQATEQDIIRHCKGKIADYKCPRQVEFRTEFPLSAAGKTLKTDLRKPYWPDGERLPR